MLHQILPDAPGRAAIAHVAQLDKAPGYEPGRCRFKSCRVLQISVRRGVWPSPSALEAGDRWFKSTRADHIVCAFGCPLRNRRVFRLRLLVVRKARKKGTASGACAFGCPARMRSGHPKGQKKRMVGRAARQRSANASRPSGRAGSIPAPSAIYCHVRLIGPGHRSFKPGNAGSTPARGTNRNCPVVQR